MEQSIVKSNYIYSFRHALEARYYLSEQQASQVLVFSYYHTNDFPIRMHSHEFYEINIVTEGKGTHYIENNSFPIKTGDFFIIPPNIKHGYSETSGLNIFHIILSDKFFLRFQNELRAIGGYTLLFNIEPKLRANNNLKIFPNISSGDFMFFNAELSKLHKLNKAEILNETEKSIKTLNLICELSSIVTSKDFTSAAHSFVDIQQITKVLSYIDNNYNTKITLSDLCKLSNMSRSSLLNQFNATCSCSPSEYILSVRIENARKLLEDSSMSIATIAQECGFFDSSHFTKCFNQKMGVLPKTYRNSLLKKN